jgi:hypothetical protein
VTKKKTTPHRKPGKPVTQVRPLPERTQHRLALLVLLALPLVFYFKYLFGSEMLFGTDWLGAGGYYARLFMSEYIRSHGNVALWMPGLLSGQPTVAAFFGDLFYPTALLRLLFPVHVVWAWTFYLHVFIAGLGTYLFLREMKVAILPAALGGVAYMFAGSLLTLTYAGHDGRLIGCALMPMAMFFLYRGMNRRQLLYFLLSGLMLALQLLSGHVQKVYYTGLILGAWFLFLWIRTIRQERSAGLAIKLAAFFGIGIGFGVALSAIQYLPIYGNMPFGARGTERGWEYATSWSMPINETLDLLSPRFSGILQDYHGKNQFKLHSEYMGLLPLLFAVVAILRRWRKATTKFFLLAFGITLLMAWGGNTPFYRIPYHLLPGISKFRGPGMIFFLASFSIAVLAGIGFDRAREWLEHRKDYRPSRTVVFATVIAAVMTFDIGLSLRLWDGTAGYIRGVPPPAQYYADDEAIAFLKTDTSLYRVLPMNYDRSDAGVLMGNGIQSAGGQMPNPLQSYQDFIGSGKSVMFRSGNLANPNFMNLLNVKYVISLPLPDDDSRYDPKSRQAIQQLRQFFARPQFEPAFIGRQHAVYRNKAFLPRAFVAPGYEVVETKEDVFARLMRPDFDPARTVLLYNEPGFQPALDSVAGTARVVEFDANRIVVRVEMASPGLLVLSENYHPAWKAHVDGKPVPVLRAYHTLRAVPLEPGKHKVVFTYQSRYYTAGTILSLLALAFFVAAAIGTYLVRRRTKS